MAAADRRAEPRTRLIAGRSGSPRTGSRCTLLHSVGANATRLVKLDIATGARRGHRRGSDLRRRRRDRSTPTRASRNSRVLLKEKLECVVLDDVDPADIEAIEKIRPGAEFEHLGARPRRPHMAGGVRRGHASDVVLRVRPRDEEGDRSCSITVPSSTTTRSRAMEPFSFKARDGLEVHGYITFPAGGRARRTCRPC